MRLYHFTDPRNIESIRRSGLLSWHQLVQQQIVHYPGSNEDSRRIDARKCLENYVHLCLLPEHSMAELAVQHKRIENSSVELNPETLEPTYKLTQGIPGRSYAIETAKRVGLPLQIINYALRFLSPVHQETEKLLLDIQNERFATRKKLEEAEICIG